MSNLLVAFAALDLCTRLFMWKRQRAAGWLLWASVVADTLIIAGAYLILWLNSLSSNSLPALPLPVNSAQFPSISLVENVLMGLFGNC